jgi:hypothetical protein
MCRSSIVRVALLPNVSLTRFGECTVVRIHCAYSYPSVLDFSRGHHANVPNFRVAPNQPARHGTAPTFVINLVLADETTS